jgi:hypothetical protein
LYSTIPFDSISLSDNNINNQPLYLFDGNSQTYISLNGINSHIQVNFFLEHFVQAVDILFFEKDLKHFIAIDYMDTGYWQPLGIFYINSDNVTPVRIHTPYAFTKSIRVRFLSVEEEGHLLSEVKISELRVLGLVEKDEPQTIMSVIPLPCPTGYYKNEEGQCVSDKTFDHIYPLSSSSNKFNKRGDKITFKFENIKKVDAMCLKIGLHQDVVFVINIPDKLQISFPLQRFLVENCIVLNNTVENVDLVEMILCTDTELEVEQFYLLGEK